MNAILVANGSLKMNNIKIQVDHSSNGAYAILARYSSLYLENCEIVDTGANNNVYCYLVSLDQSTAYIRGCHFEMYNRRPNSVLTPGTATASSESWMLLDLNSSYTVESRLSIHQTTFASLGLTGGSPNFIYTDPQGTSKGILLDDVYFHTEEVSSYTLFNDNVTHTDDYWIGGTVVSSGQTPFPAGSWNALPPSLSGWANFLVGTNRPR